MLVPLNITFLTYQKEVIFSSAYFPWSSSTTLTQQLLKAHPCLISGLSSYFNLSFHIPYLLGCQQILTPVPPFSCPTSSPEAFKPLLSKSMQDVPFPPRRVKPKLKPLPFISTLTWQPISLIQSVCAVVQAQNQEQR